MTVTVLTEMIPKRTDTYTKVCIIILHTRLQIHRSKILSLQIFRPLFFMLVSFINVLHKKIS